jgi:hypothetical protein
MKPQRMARGWALLHRRHAMALVMASTTAGGFADTALAQGGAMIISFKPGAQGNLPNGFSIAGTGEGAPAMWVTVADPASFGGFVLAQTSADRTAYRFPLAIYDLVSAVNADVTVRFKAVAGRIDRAAGIAIRLIDPDNYYVVRANALEDNVNFYRVVKGSRREIKGVSAKVVSDAWHVLGLKAEGNQFTVSFDGNVLFTTTDRTFPSAGKVALWTKADSVTHFDALSIRTLP